MDETDLFELIYRLEKRVMVPLPVAEAREEMMRKNLKGRASDDLDYAQVLYLNVYVSYLIILSYSIPSNPISSYPTHFQPH